MAFLYQSTFYEEKHEGIPLRLLNYLQNGKQQNEN
jgi:hypothetical protein